MKPWIDRLRDLEEVLAQSDPRPAISAYHDMPYAIFHYDPEQEFLFRKELDLLSTRLQNKGKAICRLTRPRKAALLVIANSASRDS